MHGADYRILDAAESCWFLPFRNYSSWKDLRSELPRKDAEHRRPPSSVSMRDDSHVLCCSSCISSNQGYRTICGNPGTFDEAPEAADAKIPGSRSLVLCSLTTEIPVAVVSDEVMQGRHMFEWTRLLSSSQPPLDHCGIVRPRFRFRADRQC